MDVDARGLTPKRRPRTPRSRPLASRDPGGDEPRVVPARASSSTFADGRAVSSEQWPQEPTHPPTVAKPSTIGRSARPGVRAARRTPARRAPRSSAASRIAVELELFDRCSSTPPSASVGAATPRHRSRKQSPASPSSVCGRACSVEQRERPGRRHRPRSSRRHATRLRSRRRRLHQPMPTRSRRRRWIAGWTPPTACRPTRSRSARPVEPTSRDPGTTADERYDRTPSAADRVVSGSIVRPRIGMLDDAIA